MAITLTLNGNGKIVLRAPALNKSNGNVFSTRPRARVKLNLQRHLQANITMVISVLTKFQYKLSLFEQMSKDGFAWSVGR